MKTSKRCVALLVCICFVVAAFFSVAFMVEHAGHTCWDDRCEVCLHITQITNQLKHMRSEFVLAILACAVIYAAFACITCAKHLPGTDTSISLKVQLNH